MKNLVHRSFGLGRANTPRRGVGKLLRLAAATAVGAVMTTLFVALPAQAAEPLPDGLTSATAAGSCWEIKQNYPSAPTGVYWLLTPALAYPQQFYCDQQTDGGGWVLVARGREAWKGSYQGLGQPQEISGTPAGQAAFKTAQLPSSTVDALLNKGRVDALADGIRLRRATNVGGTSWQEARFKLTRRDRWVWTFNAEHPVGQYRFDATTGSGGQTANFGNNSAYNRVNTTVMQTHNFLSGWAYGAQVTGQNAASSHLWTPNNGQATAIPFTQMYVRPQLKVDDLDFAQIPNSGAPASTVSAIPQSDAMPTVWGVSGFGNGSGGELNTEVAAFAEAGGKVYMGGNFRYVQRTEGGSGQVQQPYLAAFDVNSGEWVSSFRPVFNGQVKAIAPLPDGRIAVGGQFSTVNGQPQAGLAFLNASTGLPTGTQVAVENRTTGAVPYVRGLDVQGSHLYVAGSFTHLTRVGATSSASTWNGGRINLSNSTPDVNWNAFLNGASISVDASSQGDRVYFSGYFKTKNTTSTPSAVALQTSSGAPLVTPLWTPRFSKSGVDASGNITGNVWQLAVKEVGDQVWLGGSEHSFFSYDRNTFQPTSGSITKNGGDFQAAASGNGLVYGGCHCGDFVYQDTYTWSDVGSGWTQGDKINLFGAWDAQTKRYVYEFSPIVQARAGYGIWALFVDSRGIVWAGGDLSRTITTGYVNQWSGGFARFAPRDSTAPSKPGQPSVTKTDNGTKATLTWSGSTDPGGVTYEVLRENRTIASTTARSFEVPVTDTATRYFIRARDGQGNRSATTEATSIAKPVAPTAVVDLSAQATGPAAVELNWKAPTGGGEVESYVVERDGVEIKTVTAPNTDLTDSGLEPETTYTYSVKAVGPGGTSPATSVEVTTEAPPDPADEPVEIANGAQWSWRYSGSPLPSDWKDRTFDDSSWESGPGFFARGVTGAGTNIDPTNQTTKPLSAQFRKKFTVEQPETLQNGTVTVIANDGVVVYLNGTELGRSRMPAGTLTQNSYATGVVSHAAAAGNRVTFDVPANLLVEGENVLSASAHANYRSTADLSFDLALSMPR